MGFIARGGPKSVVTKRCVVFSPPRPIPATKTDGHGRHGGEGDFSDGRRGRGPPVKRQGGRVHNFGGANYNTVVAGGQAKTIRISFGPIPWGRRPTDYDLFLFKIRQDRA